MHKNGKLGYCDISKKRLFSDNEYYKIIKKKLTGYKTYFIHDNGGRPYLIYIKKNNVLIYSHSDKKIASDYDKNDNKNKWMYIKKIVEYNPVKIFIGKSPITEVTKKSNGYGKKFDGNTILLQLLNNKYIFIGGTIYSFISEDNITKFISPVGNNDVPYPVVIGEKNIYFMLHQKYIEKKYFLNLSKEIENKAYMYFYGHFDNIKLEKYSKKMKNIKEID